MAGAPRVSTGEAFAGGVAMNRLCGTIAVAALALAGCGGDTCESQPAAVTPTNQASCTVAPNTPLTFNVQLCPSCTDTSPSCTADLVGQEIHLDPVVQQCQANQGCDITQACQISPVACPVNTALLPGSYTVQYLTANGNLASRDVTVAPGGSTSCTL
jgi:hypothetical protein